MAYSNYNRGWVDFTTTSEMKRYYQGDQVRVNDLFDENYGMNGTVIGYDYVSNEHLVQFEYDTINGKTTNSKWYTDANDLVSADEFPTWKRYETTTSPSCSHDWFEDKWFTSKIFKTCRKCGMKYEDL